MLSKEQLLETERQLNNIHQLSDIEDLLEANLESHLFINIDNNDVFNKQKQYKQLLNELFVRAKKNNYRINFPNLQDIFKNNTCNHLMESCNRYNSKMDDIIQKCTAIQSNTLNSSGYTIDIMIE
ncbi:MAG: hypothetical protein OEZ01_01395 [Candidatus Heimdallarchaeota archaeon]|nr:hypothetical protein [Candidatus Heimdallarchaeota archaeon]MDH5644628.1 hypothetical protein [Candidatus Heimdallarchaeota archaeon]